MQFTRKPRSNKVLYLILVVCTLFSWGIPFQVFGKSVETVQDRSLLRTNSGFWVENKGQFNAAARYMMRGENERIWLSDNAIWFTLLEQKTQNISESTSHSFDSTYSASQVSRGVNIKLSFEGANSRASIEPFNQLETRVSYFIGGNRDLWRTSLPGWQGIRYKDLYPGIDLVIYGGGGYADDLLLNWYLEVNDGGDINNVSLSIEGPQEVGFVDHDIELETTAGVYNLPLLEVHSKENHLDSVIIKDKQSREIIALGTHRFMVNKPYSNANQPLRARAQITSGSLAYSSYLGGSSRDSGLDIAVDDTGAAYVTGSTLSTDFPVTTGVIDVDEIGTEVFVVKMNPGGDSRAYATYIGGESDDSGNAIVVENGIAYVCGDTLSSDFPSRSVDKVNFDAFVLALNQTGTDLNYVTIISGSGREFCNGIAIESGIINVTGATYSVDFIGGGGDLNGDAYWAKLDGSGSISNITSFGGTSYDVGNGIAINAGEAYVTGLTRSSDFPSTSGYHGNADAFITKFDRNGNLVFATLFGGVNEDIGYGVAVDAAGNSYITGLTYSANISLALNAFGGNRDAFVAHCDSSGALIKALYVGGSNLELGSDIALDHNGLVYITGSTDSDNFPITDGALQSNIGGSDDAFLVQLNPNLSERILYSTYLGGEGDDRGNALSLDSNKNIYISGNTRSSNFPVTAGVYNTSLNGDQDVFLAKIVSIPLLPTATPETPSLNPTWTVTVTPIPSQTPIPSATSITIPTSTIAQTSITPETDVSSQITSPTSPSAQTSITPETDVSSQPTGEQTDTSTGLVKATRTPTAETMDFDHESSSVITQMEVNGQTVSASTKNIFFVIGLIGVLVFGLILVKILGLVIALWFFVIRNP